jgi:hypothetical protein
MACNRRRRSHGERADGHGGRRIEGKVAPVERVYLQECTGFAVLRPLPRLVHFVALTTLLLFVLHTHQRASSEVRKERKGRLLVHFAVVSRPLTLLRNLQMFAILAANFCSPYGAEGRHTDINDAKGRPTCLTKNTPRSAEVLACLSASARHTLLHHSTMSSQAVLTMRRSRRSCLERRKWRPVWAATVSAIKVVKESVRAWSNKCEILQLLGGGQGESCTE